MIILCIRAQPLVHIVIQVIKRRDVQLEYILGFPWS